MGSLLAMHHLDVYYDIYLWYWLCACNLWHIWLNYGDQLIQAWPLWHLWLRDGEQALWVCLYAWCVLWSLIDILFLYNINKRLTRTLIVTLWLSSILIIFVLFFNSTLRTQINIIEIPHCIWISCGVVGEIYMSRKDLLRVNLYHTQRVNIFMLKSVVFIGVNTTIHVEQALLACLWARQRNQTCFH